MKINLNKFRKNGARGIGALDLLIGLVAACFVFAASHCAGRFQQFKADFHDHHDMISHGTSGRYRQRAEIASVDLWWWRLKDHRQRSPGGHHGPVPARANTTVCPI
ncbi:MAG: hypothetical protein H7A53_05825 [Akkermansiaceae bacterium]|nr:hypothetical protein [Akkermansiaceae bacterium]